MEKLQRQDLMSLEKYAEARGDFRAKVMVHKKSRQLHIGPNATLYFEDRLTIQYQIQEMLRIEKIFEAAGIAEELAAYNPLIPDGTNWKATFMLEYEDEQERRRQLAKLIGIEDCVWVRVAGFEPVRPVCDEDMERETETKTSSVHFMRFELGKDMAESLKTGASLAAGIDHENYSYTVNPVPDAIRRSLIKDLD